MTPAACVIAGARALRASGLTVSSLGNVSMRVGERIWITPSRVFADDLTEDAVVVVGIDGTQSGHGLPSRELPMHLEIYRRYPTTAAVVHAHSPWAVAWSYTYSDLVRQTEELRYHGLARIVCAPEADSGTLALARAAAAALGQTPVALLGGHGVITRAGSIRDALELCALAEQQAQIEWLLRGSDARADGLQAA
jgi:L-fuculose-phosphate aldolase